MDPINVDVQALETAAAEILAAIDSDTDAATMPSVGISGSVTIARQIPKLLARLELDQMMLEAKDETIARQAALLATLEFPVLVLEPTILCIPIIGPIDVERGQRLMSIALEAATRRSARHFVLDLTGAVVDDPTVANCISDVTRALKLVGVQVMLSGVRSDIAKMFIECGEQLARIPTFPTLATALGRISVRKG